MSSDFDNIAEKARESAAREEDVRESRAERKRVAIEGYKQKRTRDALAGSNLQPIVATVVFALLLGAPAFILKSLPLSGDVNRVLWYASLLCAIVVLVVGLSSKWPAKRQIAWMQSLPFYIPLTMYFTVLSVQRDTAIPQVRIGFKTVPSSQDREAISLVVGELMPLATASWSYDHLVIVGARVVTSSDNQRLGPGRKTYNNRRIHNWVRHCIRKVLLVIHDKYPIASVSPSATAHAVRVA